MNGQWRGRYHSAQSAGQITANIDDLGDHFGGIAFRLNDAGAGLPIVAAPITTTNKSQKFSLTISPLFSVNPQTAIVDRWENLRNLFPPNTMFPARADVRVEWNSKQLKLSWTTDLGNAGTVTQNYRRVAVVTGAAELRLGRL